MSRMRKLTVKVGSTRPVRVSRSRSIPNWGSSQISTMPIKTRFHVQKTRWERTAIVYFMSVVPERFTQKS